jgi:tRNA nucleotidyltransferase (CCA-adding enzyme)
MLDLRTGDRTDLKIDGNDVMKELNLKPGRKVGEILKNLFEQVVDGKLKNEKKTLLKELKQHNLK